MFRFTDKEDRVGVGVYDVILYFLVGEKDAQLKTDNRVVKRLEISDTTIDQTERNDQKKKWS
jgi:hypothetical protein